MISILIPAHNEQAYLNTTIENFLSTAKGEVEVVVVLNGYDQEVDKRAKVIRFEKNEGERVAMNAAAKAATGDYLMRIDAHCSIEPVGWDLMMLDGMKPRGIVTAPITAIDQNWKKLSGWYAFCKLLPTMEEKWVTKKEYGKLEPNMAFTGCGFLIARDFYLSFGGADESLPKMGAIGPEFACRGWFEGDGCYTRTDVLIGHIFNTGGYDTGEVAVARKKLQEKYGNRYKELAERFGEIEMKKGTKAETNKRTITINRTQEHVDIDRDGKVIQKRVEFFKYIYTDNGTGPSEKEIEEKFGPLAKKVGEDLYYPDQDGKLVKVA